MKRTQDEETKGMFYDNIEYFIYREIHTLSWPREGMSLARNLKQRKNMKKRAEKIDGKLFIESEPDNGTTIIFKGKIDQTKSYS